MEESIGNIFKRALAAVALTASLTFTASAQDQQELVIVTSGGTSEKALKENIFDPFEKVSGVEIRSVSTSDSLASVKATSGQNRWNGTSFPPQAEDINQANSGYLTFSAGTVKRSRMSLTKASMAPA
ncbi:hypothetical protein [Sinorhizobium terangae]|uniref:hypothetical protein n=1 Tax=Sinorhizobium terangae TaxID=110322 RepID=UPI0024B276C9|nr:hypothetical protein [Sinorhizobium terangae]WFU51675.1 hypothetical protein QA637_29755 [Sinorhizobium terangae]